MLDEYQERGRLLDGDAETMLDSIYEAWRTDRDEGRRILMIASMGEMAAQFNERARADLIEAGKVEAGGLDLHDGTTASVGDLVVTRLNDRRPSTGRSPAVTTIARSLCAGWGAAIDFTAMHSGCLLSTCVSTSNSNTPPLFTVPKRDSVDTAHALVDSVASWRE